MPPRPASRSRVPGPALVLALALALGCGRGEAGTGSPHHDDPVTVEIATLAPEELVDTVALTGQLEAEYSIKVKPEVDGVVDSIHFEEGQDITAGAILVKLRDGEQRARLAEAEADLRLAQDTYDRTRALTRRDAASEARRAQSAAELDRQKARVELAHLELERTRVRAAFDGVVGRRLVSPGDRVDDETPLVELDSIDRLQLLFTVEEAGVALAHTGIPIQARVAAWPGERFPGKVFFVASSLDPATRRLLLKAWIANDDHRLKPGMFANVDVEIARRPDALVIPESALVYDRNGTYVWRVDKGDHVEKVPVEIGLRREGRVEVKKGLAAGERVVTAGTNKVMAGRLVRAAVPTPAGGDQPAHARDEAAPEPGDET